MSSDQFIKLSAQDLEKYGIKKSPDADNLLVIYKKYFDKSVTPNKALILYNSEYNDESYNNSLKTVIFYDSNDNELYPLKNKSVEFHKLNYIDSVDTGESQECLEDKVVWFGVPELYVKSSS